MFCRIRPKTPFKKRGVFFICGIQIVLTQTSITMVKLDSYDSFRVKTRGHVEQLSSYNTARQSFDKLRRSLMKEDEPFKIVLEGKNEDGLWEILDSIKVNP
jgi:hypothetical protein